MRNSLRVSSSSSSVLPSLGIAVLPSDASPATLDTSFSVRSLGLHCIEDTDKLTPESSSFDR